MVDISRIRHNLQRRINHANRWDKHVSILKESYTEYSQLSWNYCGDEVRARSKDTNLLFALKECIEMYLEETEEVNETPDYQPHKFKRSGYGER